MLRHCLCAALTFCAAGALHAQVPIGIDAVRVFAERAKERSTPVAYTDFEKSDLEQNLGARSIPLLLNAAPSVYATTQSGSVDRPPKTLQYRRERILPLL